MAAVVAMAALLAGCGGGAQSRPREGSSAPPTRRDVGGVVWLCRPGQSADPCAMSLTATSVTAEGRRVVQAGRDAPHPNLDCFYVYPTVSSQTSDNSDLQIQRAERVAAMAQAARFSSVCRVWAPMYRQRTETSLFKGLGNDPGADTVAYQSVLLAWKAYLAHDNHDRPVVFIGHSQGAAVLIRLLAGQVDPDAALRARTVVAILAGGNVTVPSGRTVGATFQHLPLCRSAGQDGCVIAYSSFPSLPPVDADFGRPGRGVSLQSDQRGTTGLEVACVNPADPGGGTGGLDPYFLAAASPPPPPAVSTAWVTYPDLYTATCQSAGGASWLQVTAHHAGGRPLVGETLGPRWGYHPEDINLALGNLVQDVGEAAATYEAAH